MVLREDLEAKQGHGEVNVLRQKNSEKADLRVEQGSYWEAEEFNSQ